MRRATKEVSNAEAIRRGQRAKQILEDEVLQDAVENVRDRINESWLAADTVEDRESWWAKAQV